MRGRRGVFEFCGERGVRPVGRGGAVGQGVRRLECVGRGAVQGAPPGRGQPCAHQQTVVLPRQGDPSGMPRAARRYDEPEVEQLFDGVIRSRDRGDAGQDRPRLCAVEHAQRLEQREAVAAQAFETGRRAASCVGGRVPPARMPAAVCFPVHLGWVPLRVCSARAGPGGATFRGRAVHRTAARSQSCPARRGSTLPPGRCTCPVLLG